MLEKDRQGRQKALWRKETDNKPGTEKWFETRRMGSGEREEVEVMASGWGWGGGKGLFPGKQGGVGGWYP